MSVRSGTSTVPLASHTYVMVSLRLTGERAAFGVIVDNRLLRVRGQSADVAEPE